MTLTFGGARTLILPGRTGPATRESAWKRSVPESSRGGPALSLKALRLYDERGVLVPARAGQASGYRYYGTAQLEEARLVVMLRQLQLPLAAVKELLACDPAGAAARIAEHWRDAEKAHGARRDLAGYLVSRLRGKRPVMYEARTAPGSQTSENDTSFAESLLGAACP